MQGCQAVVPRHIVISMEIITEHQHPACRAACFFDDLEIEDESADHVTGGFRFDPVNPAVEYLLATEAQAVGLRLYPAPLAGKVVARRELHRTHETSLLPAGAMPAALVGAVVGVLIPLLAKVKRLAKWLPSPIALGIAFMVTPYSAMAMWLGAVLTSAVKSRNPDAVDRYGASLASGLIAGEGLMMVVVAILLILGVRWV